MLETIPVEKRSFLSECVAEAATDLFPKAERWKWLIGGLMYLAVVHVFGLKTSLPQFIGGQIVFDACGLALTALAIFCWGLFSASDRIVKRERSKIRQLQRQIFDLQRTPEVALAIVYEGTMASYTLAGMHRGFLVNVKHVGRTDIQDCQIQTWIPIAGDVASENWFFASAPFNLRPGESKHHEILRGSLIDPSAYIERITYIQTKDGWVSAEPATNFVQMLPLGKHNIYIRAICKDSPPIHLEITLSHEGHWDAYLPQTPSLRFVH